MTGCRIARVKDKRTGRCIEIIPQANKGSAQAVEMLQSALHQVRSGEWTSVALVAVATDGATPARWAIRERDGVTLVGMLEVLKSDIVGARS